MKCLKEYSPVICIFCLALVVRIVYNVTVAGNYTPIYDAALYNNIARNIVDEHCFCLASYRSTVSRPPLWPFIIAIIYFIAGKHEFLARLFYCFLGSGTCVLIYFFAKDIFGRRIALFSGVIAAIYTGLFIYDGWLYTESLYTFCLLMFTYSLYRLQRTPLILDLKGRSRFSALFKYGRWATLCGIFLGFVALTRPNGLILLSLPYIWAVILVLAKIMPWRAVVGNVLIITCITVLMVAPWTYRNYTVSHAFVPVSTGMGEVLRGSYNDIILNGDPAVRGMWRPPPGVLNHDVSSYTPANDKADTARALDWIRAHLSAMPYILSLHFINTWIPYTYSHGLPFEEFPHQMASLVMFSLIPIMAIPIFLLAALGLLVTWKRRKDQLLVVYLTLAMTILMNVISYGDMRFRAPIEPLLVLLAGGFVWWLMFGRNRNKTSIKATADYEPIAMRS
jgi:4-amino-4-deoxy-L-arabinose transferase-like glycosyltransferase